MRILIVEDESLIACQYRIILNFAKYTIVGVCSTGEEAIKQCALQQPDVILMDYNLKTKMTGMEASLEIRKHTNVPIIFITAYSEVIGNKQKSLIDNALFVDKPVQKDHLLKLVKELEPVIN